MENWRNFLCEGDAWNHPGPRGGWNSPWMDAQDLRRLFEEAMGDSLESTGQHKSSWWKSIESGEMSNRGRLQWKIALARLNLNLGPGGAKPMHDRTRVPNLAGVLEREWMVVMRTEFQTVKSEMQKRPLPKKTPRRSGFESTPEPFKARLNRFLKLIGRGSSLALLPLGVWAAWEDCQEENDPHLCMALQMLAPVPVKICLPGSSDPRCRSLPTGQEMI